MFQWKCSSWEVSPFENESACTNSYVFTPQEQMLRECRLSFRAKLVSAGL